jgi:Fe-S cluster assembly protein SufB
MTTTSHPELEGLERYKFGWADPDTAGASARRGLSEAVVRDISAKKNEPEWMLELRHGSAIRADHSANAGPSA